MNSLAQHIEALIFCAPKSITEFDIQDCLKEMFDAQVPMEEVHQGINNIDQRYKSEQHSFELVESGGGYQFLTKPGISSTISPGRKQSPPVIVWSYRSSAPHYVDTRTLLFK